MCNFHAFLMPSLRRSDHRNHHFSGQRAGRCRTQSSKSRLSPKISEAREGPAQKGMGRRPSLTAAQASKLKRFITIQRRHPCGVTATQAANRCRLSHVSVTREWAGSMDPGGLRGRWTPRKETKRREAGSTDPGGLRGGWIPREDASCTDKGVREVTRGPQIPRATGADGSRGRTRGERWRGQFIPRACGVDGSRGRANATRG